MIDKKILSRIVFAAAIFAFFSVAFIIFTNNWFAIFLLTSIFIIPIFYLSKNKKTALLVGAYGGIFGFLTEYWGCSLGLWVWVDVITLWNVNGVFPVEMAIIYFYCGIWVNQVFQDVFEKQIEEHFQDFRPQFFKNKIQNVILVIVFVACYTIFIIERIWIQSMLILSTGLLLVSFIPKKKIIWVVAIVVGFSGLFLENFATGGAQWLFPGLVIWQYNPSLHINALIPNPMFIASPISAVIAYTGSGIIMGSILYLGNYYFYFKK